jgi:hypothetical protein
MTQAVEDYHEIFQTPPKSFAAAGWQVNPHLFVLEEKLGFAYASDTRGKSPFRPELQSMRSKCIQVPTTLPTLSDMLLTEGVTRENVHEYIYAESQYVAPHGHVYSLDAEMEGIRYLSSLEKLLVMWAGYGEGLGRLDESVQNLHEKTCNYHQVGWKQAHDEQYQAWQSIVVNDTVGAGSAS